MDLRIGLDVYSRVGRGRNDGALGLIRLERNLVARGAKRLHIVQDVMSTVRPEAQ